MNNQPFTATRDLNRAHDLYKQGNALVCIDEHYYAFRTDGEAHAWIKRHFRVSDCAQLKSKLGIYQLDGYEERG